MDYKPSKIVNHINRQYYLIIERQGSPISMLKHPLNIGLSELSEPPMLPAFFYAYTADELSDYLIENSEKLNAARKKTFEDALIVLSGLGKNAKMYLTYEEKK